MTDVWVHMQGTGDKIRMFGDGSTEFTSKLGLDQDLSKRGMGVRFQRYAVVVKDDVVTVLQAGTSGQFPTSSTESIFAVF